MPKRKKEKRLLPVWEGEAKDNVRMPEVIVYTEVNFGGDEFRTHFNVSYVGEWFNDDIYSIVVLSGEWEFYKHAEFSGLLFTLKPGYYPKLKDEGISSYKCISQLKK